MSAKSRVTRLEMLLYDACVAYRNANALAKAGQKNKDRRLMLRGKIRGLAEALVWTSESESKPHISQIKAVEREYQKRALQDPPF